MDNKSNENTTVDRWLIVVKNHSVLARVVFLGIIVIAIGSVTESIEKIQSFVTSPEKEDSSFSDIKVPTFPSKKVEEVKSSTVILEQGFSYSGVSSCDDKRDREESIKVCNAGAEAYAKSNSVSLISVVMSTYSSTISNKKEAWPSNARSCKSKGTAKCEIKFGYNK